MNHNSDSNSDSTSDSTSDSNSNDSDKSYGLFDVIHGFLSSFGYYDSEISSEHPIINDKDYNNNPAIDNDKDESKSESQAILIINEPDKCPICLDEMDKERSISLKCRAGSHKFHESCMACTLSALHSDRLFPNITRYYNFKCPLCRDVHQYQVMDMGYSKISTMTFKEYWFWKSIWIYSMYENALLSVGISYLYFYISSLYEYNKNVDNNTIVTTQSIGFCILCIVLFFKIVDLYNMVSVKRMQKYKYPISTYNFPIIPYIMLVLAIITHYLLFKYLREGLNTTDTKIIMYLSGPIMIMFMLINKSIIKFLVYEKPHRRDNILKQCQLISNLHWQYRKRKKKMFAMSFEVINNHQTIIIKNQ
jgi:hypothetical protein